MIRFTLPSTTTTFDTPILRPHTTVSEPSVLSNHILVSTVDKSLQQRSHNHIPVLPAIMPGVPRQPSIEDISSSSDSGKENASPTPLVQVAGKSIPTNNQQYPDAEDPYSIDGVPKLERFIEMDHLPEVLVVFDRSNVTNRGTKRAGQPLRYKRVFPEVPARTREPREGQLHLDSSNLVAEGRRSCVHRAPLVATLHPTDASPTRVAVVAKTATSCCRSHHLLREEAKGYAAFPREFFEDSELIPADAPLKAHRPAMRPRGFPGWGVAMNPKSKPKNLAPPIVPNFYGLYVPMNSKGKVLARTHEECKDFANSDCYVPHWPNSILLMQDCGEPVEQPEGMSLAHREHCLELVQRMHRQGFSRGSPIPGNMLVQAGPLTAPPEERSMDSPSYRLISFGRWRGFAHILHLESALGAKRAFEKGRERDVLVMMQELGFINIL